jgi:hypothetical protein
MGGARAAGAKATLAAAPKKHQQIFQLILTGQKFRFFLEKMLLE